MKKQKFMLGCYFFAFLFAIPIFSYGQLSKSYVFNKADLELKNLKKNGKDYKTVNLKGKSHSSEVGKPNLPTCYYSFYVPKGQKVTGVTFKGSSKSEIDIDFDLMPVQPSIPGSLSNVDTIFVNPDAAVYNKNGLYPEILAKVLRSDFVDGDIEIVTIELYPLQYNPKQKRIVMATSGVLEVKTTGSANNKAVNISNNENIRHSLLMVNMAKSKVENPLDIPDADTATYTTTKKSKLKTGSTGWQGTVYEYIVVTSRALKPAFNQLITWKRMKGLDAGVVCIEDIIDDPMAWGDYTSGIQDSAGILRQYLGAMWACNKTVYHRDTYVLLGGDFSVVPVRYGSQMLDTWQYVKPYDVKTPSDLYYSDFHGNWNADGADPDGTTRYGEPNSYGNEYGDQVDYGPEAFVGRILCTTTQEVETWTYKVLKYEQKPGNGNYNYLRKSLISEADDFDNPPLYTEALVSLPIFSYFPYPMEEKQSDSDPNPSGPTGNSVISELNKNYGLYSIACHGYPHGYLVCTKKINEGNVYGVTSSNAINNFGISENANGFDNLTNYDYPTIVYSQSCTNMPFDNWKTTSGKNLGASFTTVFKGGGPAYLGYTRYSYPVNYSNELERNFFNCLSANRQIGIAEANSKIGFYDHATAITHNLLGCPEMPMWTTYPKNSTIATVSWSGSNITATFSKTPAQVVVMSVLDNSYYAKSSLMQNVFYNVPSPYYIAITKPGGIPQINGVYNNSLDNVYIQLTTMSSMVYLNCTNVSAGYQVDPNPNRDPGNVLVSSTANVVFEATGVITLAPGFEVQLGATFEAK